MNICCVLKFQDDCRDFIKQLKAVAKSELSKVHVDYILYIIRLFKQKDLRAQNLIIIYIIVISLILYKNNTV